MTAGDSGDARTDGGAHPDAAQAQLDALLRRAAAAPVDYPPGLVNRSLATVRAERAAGGPFELAQDRGVLRISTPAVTALVQRLGTEFCAVLGGLRQREVRVSAAEVLVNVEVGYGVPAERAGQLGAALTEALAGLIGPVTPGVTVHLGDVYSDDGRTHSE